jgi:uncharacterized protein (TIGR00299 family) protein
MGAAGDMIMAALLELLPDQDGFLKEMNQLGIPGVLMTKKKTINSGISGTQISVLIRGEEEETEDMPDFSRHETEDMKRNEHGHVKQEQHGHHETYEHSYKGMNHTYDGMDHSHEIMRHSHEGVAHVHKHTGMAQVEHIIGQLHLSDKVKADALSVYHLIAEAESKVHDRPVGDIHFHEVGRMDAIADIVGVCLLMEKLAPKRVIASPIPVGKGYVKCAHGILPVPAPATAYLLKGIPTYAGIAEGELCTPTGAALLKYFAEDFVPRPLMTTEAIGYGMGKKDFKIANCLRAYLGDTAADADTDRVAQSGNEVIEINCNLDDMTGEELGFATERLIEAGALEVYVVPVTMKKNRPGHLLVCLCHPEEEEKMTQLILKHTTTLGVRCHSWRRHTMEREILPLQTQHGTIHVKESHGFGCQKSKLEYEDLADYARKMNLSLWEARKILETEIEE